MSWLIAGLVFSRNFLFFLLKSSKETPKVENSKPIRWSFNGPAPDWSPDGPAANHRPLIPSVGVGCVGQCHHRPESAAVQETFDRLRGRHAAGESPSLSLFICFFLAALSVVVFTSFHDFSIALFVRFSWSVWPFLFHFLIGFPVVLDFVGFVVVVVVFLKPGLSTDLFFIRFFFLFLQISMVNNLLKVSSRTWVEMKWFHQQGGFVGMQSTISSTISIGNRLIDVFCSFFWVQQLGLDELKLRFRTRLTTHLYDAYLK